jgi:hypothetical protein
VTGSAELDDRKSKNIIELNQSLMSLDCFQEERDFFGCKSQIALGFGRLVMSVFKAR